MTKLRGSSATFLLVCFILSPRILSTVEDGGLGHQEEKASLTGIATTTFVSSWDKLKSLINQGNTYLFPPNIERNGETRTGGERVKEAVGKSLGTSKATIEDTAKSAAKVVGDAMHKTSEKVTGTKSETAGEAEL